MAEAMEKSNDEVKAKILCMCVREKKMKIIKFM